MGKILSIDLGTTYFKMSLFDRNGRLCDTCRLAPPVVASQVGYMELPAKPFADVIFQGIGELRKRASTDLMDVRAITFATQTNSFVLLDSKNRPLMPLILWPDCRAVSLDSEVRSRCDLPEFSARTGLPQAGIQCMPAKLLWLQNQLPETWKRANKVCLISDYLTILLTGKHVSEAGAAGLTGLVDIHRCEWWPEMLARFELDHCSLPTLVRAGTDLGPIHSPAAERFGLPRDCRFVVGCLDQYAGAIGMGCVNPNMISETTGTVLATVQCTDQFATPVSLDVFQGPAFRKGLYWRMAFGEVSANYLEWYRDQLRDRPDFDQLTELAEQIEPGAHGLRLRTNERPTELEKVFDGLTSRHTRGDMVRCIMEAVARALADQVSTLSKGAPPLEIRCAGGAARNDFWLQIKADVAGITTVASECEEPTSLGAAMLAEASLSSTDLLQLTQQWVRLKSLHRCNTQYHHNKRSLHSHAVGAT